MPATFFSEMKLLHLMPLFADLNYLSKHFLNHPKKWNYFDLAFLNVFYRLSLLLEETCADLNSFYSIHLRQLLQVHFLVISPCMILLSMKLPSRCCFLSQFPMLLNSASSPFPRTKEPLSYKSPAFSSLSFIMHCLIRPSVCWSV